MNTKIVSKPFYTQSLSYDTFEMQKKTPVMTHVMQKISPIEWYTSKQHTQKHTQHRNQQVNQRCIM